MFIVILLIISLFGSNIDSNISLNLIKLDKKSNSKASLEILKDLCTELSGTIYNEFNLLDPNDYIDNTNYELKSYALLECKINEYSTFTNKQFDICINNKDFKVIEAITNIFKIKCYLKDSPKLYKNNSEFFCEIYSCN